MKKNKRIIAILLVLVMTLLTACGGSKEGEKTAIKMGTGGTSGTYYAYGGVISQTLSSNIEGLSFDVQSTGASKANLQLIHDGEIQMATVQSDTADYAFNGTDLFEGEKIDNFEVMAGLYSEVCQVIASPSINSIEDLKGKRVSVGDIGSGVEFNARQILEAYGMTFDDIVVNNLGFGDSAAAFKDGKIDAFFVTAGEPTTAIVELTTSTAIKILSVDDAHADALIAKYPFYSKYVIKAGTYKNMEEDVATVAVKAIMVVSKDLSEDLVYNMTKTLFEKKDEIAQANAKGAQLDPAYAVDGISVPFHPGAKKYFVEAGVLE